MSKNYFVLSITSISAVDYDTAWAYMEKAASYHPFQAGVHHTTDGGKTWERVSDRLIDVLAVDIDKAWGLDQNGAVYRTNDRGKNWETVSGNLEQISVVDYDTAWGVNSSRNIFRTKDGGKTWAQTSGKLGEVAAIDYDTAWGTTFYPDAVLNMDFDAPTDRLYRTNDGGANWEEKTGFLYILKALDYNTLWGFGDRGNIYYTNNGAASWNTIFKKHDACDVFSVIDENTLWAIIGEQKTYSVENKAIKRSKDKGKSWE